MPEQSSQSTEEKEILIKNSAKLFDYLKKSVDLVEYIERYAGGCFEKKGDRWKTLCVLPGHQEKTPSFLCNQNENGVWFFWCFGCSRGGTIIDFAMHYNGLEHSEDAMLFLADQLDLTSNMDWLSREVVSTRHKSQQMNMVELEHYLLCSRIRNLMIKYRGNHAVEKWAMDRCKALNHMLSDLSGDTADDVASNISKISSMVSRVMGDVGFIKTMEQKQ